MCGGYNLTMSEIVRVFVSSTWIDLQPEREAVERVFQKLRETKFVGMEYFGSRGDSTMQASVDEVDRSAVFVGIIGGRYGSGITEAEYRRALQKGLPCFFYFKDDSQIKEGNRDVEPEKSAQLTEFKRELRERHIGTIFSNPDQLATCVSTDLHNWLFDKYPGGRYQAIIHLYPQLRDYVYDFSGLIADVTQHFVGRELFFDAVSNFQKGHPCGYLCISADAGLGKTALAAEVARRYSAAAFFANTSAGLTHAHQCLTHLCAELIARFDLPYDHLPARCGEDCEFLKQVLAEAVGRGAAPLFIVIDALDEADMPLPGRNLLLLPDRLPPGVFFVVTYRRISPLLVSAGTFVAEIPISADAPEHRKDINEYLRRWAERPEFRDRSVGAVPALTPEQFVRVLGQASGGNFKYLEYVIEDLLGRNAGNVQGRLRQLPEGLKGYYAQFWSEMEATGKANGWREWDALFRPALALIGVAAQPVSKEWLGVHLQRDPREIEERVLIPWSRFLSRECRNGMETWRIVHQSFADFLAEKVDLHASHRSIAAYYCANSARWSEHNGYASRHLVGHLRQAGNSELLFALIDDDEWFRAQMATDLSGATFLHDITEVWTVVDSLNQEAMQKDRPLPLLRRTLRCALAAASIHSMSGAVPEALINELLGTGLWTPQQALSAIRQDPSQSRRSHTLIEILPGLPDSLLAPVLDIALEIQVQWERAKVLSAILPRLPDALLRQAWEAVLRIDDISISARPLLLIETALRLPDKLFEEVIEDIRLERLQFFLFPTPFFLVGVGSRLPDAQLREALSAARACAIPSLYVQALAALAQHLRSEFRERIISEVLDCLGQCEDEHTWERVCSMLMPVLTDPLRDRVFSMALGKGDQRECALDGLVPYMDAESKRKVLDKALNVVRSYDRVRLSWAVKILSKYLPPAQAEVAVKEALDVICSTADEFERCAELGTLLPHLPATLRAMASNSAYDAALSRSQTGHHEQLTGLIPLLPENLLRRMLEYLPGIPAMVKERSRVLAALSRLAEGPSRKKILRDVLAETRLIGDRTAVATTLIELLRYMPEELVLEQLEVVVRMDNRQGRVSGLIRLVPHLKGEHWQRAVKEALTSAMEIFSQTDNAWALRDIIPLLNDEARQQVLEKAQEIATGKICESDGADALIEMLPCLPGESRERVAQTAFEIVMAGPDSFERTWNLMQLLPHLARDSKIQAVERALGSTEQDTNLNYIGTLNIVLELLPYLDEVGKRRALELGLQRIFYGMTDLFFDDRLRSLRAIAPHLSEESLTQAMDAIEAIGADSVRGALLGGLAPYLSKTQLSRGLQTASGLRDTNYARADALLAFVPYLSEAQLNQTLEITFTLEGEPERAIVLEQLVARVPDVLIDRTICAAFQLKDNYARAVALTSLIPRRPDQGEVLTEKALTAARYAETAQERAQALTSLIVHVDGPMKAKLTAEAIQAGSAIVEENDKVRVMKDLASTVPEVLLPGVLDASQGVASRTEWREFLKALTLSRTSSGTSVPVLYQLWRRTLWILAGQTREELVRELVALLPPLIALGGSGADLAYEIREAQRHWP